MKKLLAGLCLSCGIFVCCTGISQSGSDDLVLGLVEDKIEFYPLQDVVSFSCMPKAELSVEGWNGSLEHRWEDGEIILEASSNTSGLTREGTLIVDNGQGTLRRIALSQKSLEFFVLGVDDERTLDVQGQSFTVGVQTNVKYGIATDVENVEILAVESDGFDMKVNSSTSLNGVDNKIDIEVKLFDKDDEEEINVSGWEYVLTLIQKAFMFKWTDGTVDEVKSVTWKFNDTKANSWKFVSSGKWSVTVAAENDWDVKIRDGQGTLVTEDKDRVAGEFTVSLAPKSVNKDQDNSLKGEITLVSEAYPDDPLIIKASQEKAPPISLSPNPLELLEYGEKKQLSVIATGLTEEYRVVSWESDNPEVADVDSEGIVKPGINGKAKITATIVIGEGEPFPLTCDVTVVKEFGGANPGDNIDKEEGEW